VVRLLIEYGADKDAVDNDKKTPLNYAIEGKHESLFKYLKSMGQKMIGAIDNVEKVIKFCMFNINYWHFKVVLSSIFFIEIDV
jgi:ankyrin repeat protein